MSQPKKRRRVLLPLLLSTGVLTTAGAGVWRLKSTENPVSAEESAPSGLSAVADSWGEGKPLAVPDTTSAGGDPFLQSAFSAPSSVPNKVNPEVTQAVYTGEQSVGRYGAPNAEATAEVTAPIEAPLTRGQSPARLSSSSDPSVGNPLRSSTARSAPQYDSRAASEAREAFGATLAERGSASGVIRVAASDPEEAPEAFRAESVGEPLSAIPEPIPYEAAPSRVPEEPAGLPPFGTLPQQPELAPPSEASAPLVEEIPPTPYTPQSDPFQRPAEVQQPPLKVASSQPLQTPPAQLTPPAPEPSFAATPPATFAPAPDLPAEPSQFSPGELSEPLSAAPSGNDAPASIGRPGERAMEGRQQPSLAIQKFSPEEIQVGKPCKFIVKVRNVGQRPAVGVVVRDQTPTGTRLMSTNPRAENEGDGLVWRLGALSPGEERSLEMELIPTEEGEIGSVATVSFSAQASAKSRCTRPQLAIRMTAPGRVLVGRQQRVQIELHNPGTGDATGVMLFENVPENLRHEAGAALEFEVGTLRAGETRRMELVMNAERAGPVVNVLTARADGNLEVQQKVEFEVVAPDLAVELEGPSRRYLERPATYTVKINNPGTAAAKDVRLVTHLPQGMRFVKANNLGEYDASTHAVYWSLAELPEGEQGEVKLTALPVTSGELTLQVQGEAQEGLKDETAMAINIEGIAALSFEVLDVEDPIEIGGETTYEVRVANQGTKAATNVSVRLVTPPGLKAVAASGETRHRLQNGAVVFEPMERLAPQAESLFRVRVEGVQPGDHRLRVEVVSDDLAQPVRKEESTRVFGDE